MYEAQKGNNENDYENWHTDRISEHIIARAFVNWHCYHICVNNQKLICIFIPMPISFKPNVNKISDYEKKYSWKVFNIKIVGQK